MLRLFERVLGVRRGERGRTLLLFLFLFLVISTYVAGKAARDALFLEQYSAVHLPYADMAVAALVSVLVALYMRGRRRLRMATLVVGSLLFFASNALVLWWLGRAAAPPSFLPIVVYVWVGMFGVIGPAQVWTVANYVLTLREAKRLFSLIGSGAILGWILGGLMTTTTATRYGTNDVLLAIAVALVLCAAIVVLLWRRRPATLTRQDAASVEGGDDAPRSLWGSLHLVCGSPYLRAVALVVGVSSLVTGVAAWQFKAIAKEAIPATNDLAAFFGAFNVYAGLLALAMQVLFTSRVLRTFGVGVALFIVPLSLTLGTAGVLVWGTLAAVVVLKGSDQVLRYSIDKATVELLFLPVSPAHTFHAKLLIDGIVWRAGDALGAMTVLVAAGIAGLSAAGVGWINLVFLAGWLAAAYAAYRQYVTNLSDSVHQHRLDAERASAPVIDRSMQELITSKLGASEAADVLYGLSLLDVCRERTPHAAVRALLAHPSAEVRARAIGILAEARDLSVLPLVEHMLRDEDIRVRTEALLYLAYHGNIDPLARIDELADFHDFSVRSAMVAFLARQGPTQNLDAASMLLDNMVAERSTGGVRTRLEAARLIAILPNHFETQLAALLEDPNPDVVRHAIQAVGKLCRRTFAERVIRLLGEPAFARDAAEALASCGDRVVGTLRDHLMDDQVAVGVRRGIPDVLAQIGTPAGGRALLENLMTPDARLRSCVIDALDRFREAHPESPVDRQAVESALLAEVMGHYRSYEILATLGLPAGHGDDPVARGLRESMTHEMERIVRLLQLLFPDEDIRGAYVGVRSTNTLIHDKALELLEHVLRPQLRTLIVPLFDRDVSTAERIDLANRILGRGLGSREEAVAALIYSEDPWLEACAAYSIGALGLRSLEHELDRWLDNPDPLLRETARHSKAQLLQQSASSARVASHFETPADSAGSTAGSLAATCRSGDGGIPAFVRRDAQEEL